MPHYVNYQNRKYLNTATFFLMTMCLLLSFTKTEGLHLTGLDRNHKLFWPLWSGSFENEGYNKGYEYLTEPFGPRNIVKPEDKYLNADKNWFHTGLDIGATGTVYNPYMGEGPNGGKAIVVRYDGNDPDAKWVVIKQVDEVHEVTNAVFRHVVTDNVQVNQTASELYPFQFQVKSPNPTFNGAHLHFECYTDPALTGHEKQEIRNVYSRDPLRWLHYPYSGDYNQTNAFLFHNMETNKYFHHDGTGQFVQVTNPVLDNYNRIVEFDIGTDDSRDHVMVRVMQKKPGMDISCIEILPANQNANIYFDG